MAFEDTFKALSDPVRRRILTLLKDGMMSAGDIAKALGKTEDEVKLIFTYYDMLDKFEKDLQQL